MKAISCNLTVDLNHQAVISFPEEIAPGKHRVVVVIADPAIRQDSSAGDQEIEALLAASESSLAFWDNPIDDEVWNHA